MLALLLVEMRYPKAPLYSPRRRRFIKILLKVNVVTWYGTSIIKGRLDVWFVWTKKSTNLGLIQYWGTLRYNLFKVVYVREEKSTRSRPRHNIE